jgi:hypothetical protein
MRYTIRKGFYSADLGVLSLDSGDADTGDVAPNLRATADAQAAKKPMKEMFLSIIGE